MSDEHVAFWAGIIFGSIFGAIVGMKSMSFSWQSDAIESGAGRYNASNGNFEWIPIHDHCEAVNEGGKL